MHDIIDAIPLGDAPWRSFTAPYTGPRPLEGKVPCWMNAEHVVWYCDPRIIVRNMLANPDFKDQFDAAPYRCYDANGRRHYQHLMSGNWAWEQSVSLCNNVQCLLFES